MGACSCGNSHLRDETATGGVLDTTTLLDVPDRMTVREIVRHRVREEVARHNASPERIFRGLVQPTDAERVLDGYDLRTPRTLEWERQADVAERAFARNGFIVLVGDRQVESLDEVVDLTGPDAGAIAFVRLVALVGG